MLRLHKNHPKQPVPAWSFKADATLLVHETADGLIKKLREYRLNNGQPPGDPEGEIAQAIAPRYPHLVHEVEDVDGQNGVANAVWAWVNRIWKEAPKGAAEKDVVDERAEQCTGCPFELKHVGDGEAHRRAYIIAQGNLPVQSCCAFHRWHNGIAVKLKEPAKVARPQAPDCCWLAE